MKMETAYVRGDKKAYGEKYKNITKSETLHVSFL